MFRHPAWAVGSYSSGPLAAKTVGTKSTGGCYHQELSPCSNGKRAGDNCVDWETLSFPAAASPGGPRPPQLDTARVHVEEEEPQVFQERHLRYAANDVNRSRE